MNRYTIYCTSEQTKKALELGAPIDYCLNQFDIDDSVFIGYVKNSRARQYAVLPTAEQIIGWLEEQHPIDHIDVYKQATTWNSVVYMSTLERRSKKGTSRQEAILAAIDVALEYLREGGKE